MVKFESPFEWVKFEIIAFGANRTSRLVFLKSKNITHKVNLMFMQKIS